MKDEKLKYVYFIGIGGIGMSAIARWYKFKGFEVSGYDRTPSPLTASLESEGISLFKKSKGNALGKPECNNIVTV